ncbi:ammonia-dependent NAD(+) synthetase [Bacillus haynesii]|uniref:ammonia-dependent NAD(+) synthetase n=1 Tax=Bacillus haynesii TaxID=1925021 RepID=UPI00227E632F|nr:ammonia-dependent NAD(+) synthetase [Bacillus haynesii]MCY7770197.1 ammonia-dependent NAD(+) synthetase [Bacillus haynesii]MCY7914128.1 ammonia-dependent NAD(+) synthetase [Bacillus haynesii]MCY7925604.1 ammonia-dependent NAD(+) synthetase [Bacillus haynesii]MCY8011135.1 ammonia-dependent NAD(+) synthetase [Bacillus haynesii]MCY8102087.1 ammonia-dependent NAD(+) synthetase [Bacillus haynesii]
MTLQEKIMQELNVKPSIEPKQEIEKRVGFLKSYLKKTGAKGFVLGISGGQDSTLAGRLAQLAVEELREEGVQAEFIAVRLPYGVQQDEDDAQLALKFIQPDKSFAFDIASTVGSFAAQYQSVTGEELADFHKGNVKARVRMITQYAIGGQNQLLVIGTDHAAEAVTGFFTKYGDGGADLLPLTGLTKRQGRSLLEELGAPERLYTKSPTADLLDEKPQQSDETELGLTYDNIDDYLEGKAVSSEVAEAIEKRYKASEHKRQVPASMFDEWWK